jgi:hypothetical protein
MATEWDQVDVKFIPDSKLITFRLGYCNNNLYGCFWFWDINLEHHRLYHTYGSLKLCSQKFLNSSLFLVPWTSNNLGLVGYCNNLYDCLGCGYQFGTSYHLLYRTYGSLKLWSQKHANRVYLLVFLSPK